MNGAMSADMSAMMTVNTTTAAGHTGEDPPLLTTAEDRTGHDHALAPTPLVITEVKCDSIPEDDVDDGVLLADVDVFLVA